MRLVVRSPYLLVALVSASLGAQAFDPVKTATGWARMDKDGSITFFDPASRGLRTWMRDGGEIGAVSLARLEDRPEKWAVDPYGNAWVVAGGQLYLVDGKSGKVSSKDRLPGDVSDIAWDPKGFVLCYQGAEPYLEKREYRSGSVIWSYGAKPRRGPGAAMQRIALGDEGQIVLANGVGLPVTIIEGGKGKATGQTAFSYKGLAAPDLLLGESARGPMVFWSGRNLVFAAVTGRQVPEAKMSGLLLARMDMGQSAVDFVPTGLTEDHTLVGVQDGQAVFVKPGGGLAFVAVQ
jgi:hypothetical protein